MIKYISKDEALAQLVAKLLSSPDNEIAKRVRARIEWIKKEIPDGFDVNQNLIEMSMHAPQLYEI